LAPSLVFIGTDGSAGRNPWRSAVAWTAGLRRYAISAAPARACSAVTHGAASSATG
jgi:hypothetical protein